MKIFIATCLLFLSFTIFANETTWTGNGVDSLWSTAGNWSNGVPGGGDTAIVHLTANQPFVASNSQLSRLTINNGVVLTIQAGFLFTLQGSFNSDPNVKNFGTINNFGIFQMNTNETGIANYGIVNNYERIFFAEYEMAIKNFSGGVINNFNDMSFNTVFKAVENCGDFINNGTLSGDISFFGNAIVNNGILSPGNSPGTLSFQGGLIMNSQTTYACELFGTNSNQVDRIFVSDTSSIVINGTLEVTLENGFMPIVGDTFKIMEYGPMSSGDFSEFDLPDIAPNTWDPIIAGDAYQLAVVQPEYTNLAKVMDGSLSIENIGEGIILKSPNGSCWKLSVDDSGTIISESVTCPE